MLGPSVLRTPFAHSVLALCAAMLLSSGQSFGQEKWRLPKECVRCVKGVFRGDVSLEEFQRCKGQLSSGSYSDALRAGKLDDVVRLVVLNAADEESEDEQFKWLEDLDAHELKLAEEPFIRAMSKAASSEKKHLANALFDGFVFLDSLSAGCRLSAVQIWALEEVALLNLFEVPSTVENIKRASDIREFMVDLCKRSEGISDYDLVSLSFNHAMSLVGSYQFDRGADALEWHRSLHESNEWFKESQDAFLDYVSGLTSLGTVYEFAGDDVRSLRIFRNALAVHNEESDFYDATLHTWLLSSYASALKSFGFFGEALRVQLQESELTREIYGENSESFATSTWLLGSLYFSLDQLQAAEIMTEYARQLDEKHCEKGSYTWALSLENLAAGSMERGDLSRAEELYDEALGIYLEEFGSSSPITASCELSLGEVCFELHRFQKALEMTNQAILSLDSHMGVSVNLADAFAQKGRILAIMGESEAAIEYMEKGLLMTANILGDDNYWSANNRLDLASLEFKLGRFDLAVEGFTRAYNTLMQQLELQEAELGGKLNQGVLGAFEAAVRGIYAGQVNQERAVDYQLWMDVEGRVQRNSFVSKADLVDSDLVVMREAYTKALSELSTELNTSDAGAMKIQRIARKQLEIQNLEFQLSRALTNSTYQVSDLAKVLGEGEVVIDIVPAGIEDETGRMLGQYIAFVTNHHGTLTRSIGEISVVDSIVRKHNDFVVKPGGYSHMLRAPYDSTLLKPFQGDLGASVKRVIYRPSGAFRSLSLGNLLLPESGTEVITQFEVMRITSVYDFIQGRLERPALLDIQEGSAVVFANPDFDDLNFTEMGSTGLLETRNGISPLPFTETEANVVADILKDGGVETKVFLGDEASELNFKTSDNVSIVHLATHGFSNGGSNRSVVRSKFLDDFHGCGLILSPESRSATGRNENGWLTASEVTSLDLGGTRLAVLSACNTSNGASAMRRGDYSLAKAFLQSGVDATVSSLWEVDDSITAQLMSVFYERLMSGESVSEALRNAQMATMREHRQPVNWGAWVVTVN